MNTQPVALGDRRPHVNAREPRQTAVAEAIQTHGADVEVVDERSETTTTRAVEVERDSLDGIHESTSPLVINCFGGRQVLCGDRVLWPAREFAHERRAWELLFFLAGSAPEGVDRDIIGAALRPEVDPVNLFDRNSTPTVSAGAIAHHQCFRGRGAEPPRQQRQAARGPFMVQATGVYTRSPTSRR